MANSELAVCSRASEAGGLAFATVLGPLVATWMIGGGGAAEFATSVSGFRIHTPRRNPDLAVGRTHMVAQHRSNLPGVEAMTLLTDHVFPRHSHDGFGIGIMTAGAQRLWSGIGPVESTAGDVITVSRAGRGVLLHLLQGYGAGSMSGHKLALLDSPWHKAGL